jgi:hypothetical protein
MYAHSIAFAVYYILVVNFMTYSQWQTTDNSCNSIMTKLAKNGTAMCVNLQNVNATREPVSILAHMTYIGIAEIRPA